MTKYMIWILILLIIDLCIVLGGWLYEKKRYEELKERLHRENPPLRPSWNDLPIIPITAVTTIPYDVVRETSQVAEKTAKGRLTKLLGEQVIKRANIYTESNVRDMNYRVVAKALVIDQSSLNVIFPGEEDE